jgi:hypothetical protein
MSKNTDTTNATPSAKRKPRRKAGAGGTAAPPEKAGPGRPRHTANAPRLTAFLAAIPEVCAVFGIASEDLLGRRPANSYREAASLALRKHCLGAIAALGRALGMPWSAMYGSDAPLPFRGAHKTTISSFIMQFYQWVGLNEDRVSNITTPASEVAGFVLARYKQIREAAIIAAGGGVVPATSAKKRRAA